MRDTFTKIFPSYPHGEPTTYNDPNKSFTHLTIVYPRRFEGKRLHEINREYTHKKDEMKQYSESMYKISDMYDMKRTKV